MNPDPETSRSTDAENLRPPPIPALGNELLTRPVTTGRSDVEIVTRWMNEAHVAQRWEQAWNFSEWYSEIAQQTAGNCSRPVFVLELDTVVAYTEIYWVSRSPLASLYFSGDYDLGVHIAIGAKDRTGRGLGKRILRDLAQGLLQVEPDCGRVIAEPNVCNEAAIGAFVAAGFRRAGEVRLPHKVAALMVYPRAEDDPLLHPEAWRQA